MRKLINHPSSNFSKIQPDFFCPKPSTSVTGNTIKLCALNALIIITATGCSPLIYHTECIG